MPTEAAAPASNAGKAAMPDPYHREQLLAVIRDSFEFARGHALPLGATVERGGVNFSLFSKHASGVTLVLYRAGAPEPVAEFPLDPGVNRTGHIWHAFVGGIGSDIGSGDSHIGSGVEYGYRVRGAGGGVVKDTGRGSTRFDPELVLLDPYARGCVRVAGTGTRHSVRRSVVVDESFDWQHDQPLDRPLADSVLYELHVRAFTRSPSAGVASPGTFAGLIEKIPYLQGLGITAVELLPVVEFDEQDNPRTDPGSGEPLVNFWGYHPLSFFAPHLPYGSAPGPSRQSSAHTVLGEMKAMVRAFHRAGIEVLLDVVFNHTGEGGPDGPTTSLRGIDNQVYYLVDPATGQYRDYSGCGNTLNCNHPVVREFVLDCLRYWVTEVHIDGFRFDLASVLGRGQDGQVLSNPPLLERIAGDPVLARTKLIAEAWDATGLYQVGSFPYGERWAEWNGQFRDDIRRFVRGDRGMVPALATRLAGSADLYEWSGRAPHHSINFVTCHDGFTLADLVAYNSKHNDANGENNRDGTNDNCSWNCGIEGPGGEGPGGAGRAGEAEGNDDAVQALRQRQVRNLATLLLCAHGVPMVLYGDEMGRSQRGNNNLYCHDSPRSWVDWDQAQENAGLVRFFSLLTAFRTAHAALRRTGFATEPGKPGTGAGMSAGMGEGTGEAEDRNIAGENSSPRISLTWHGTQLFAPDWGVDSHALALHLTQSGGARTDAGDETGDGAEDHLYLIANAYWESLVFELPRIAGWEWYRVVDTSLASPLDIAAPGAEQRLKPAHSYQAAARTTVVLLARPGREWNEDPGGREQTGNSHDCGGRG